MHKLMTGIVMVLVAAVTTGASARTMSMKAQSQTAVTLEFGAADGKDYTLCLASGTTDGLDRKRNWTAFETVATVAADQTVGTYEIPPEILNGQLFRFFLMQTNSLPYSSEVEFVRSNSKQYVDTGIFPDTTTEVELDFGDVTYVNNGELFGQLFYGNRYLFAMQNDNFCFYGPSYKGLEPVLGQTRYFCRVADDNTLTLIHGSTTNRHEGISRVTTSNAGNLTVFGDANKSFLTTFTFYSMRIAKSGVMKRDFIPVIDSTGNGCLYDMISGELFKSKTETALIASTTVYADRIGRVLATTPTLHSSRSLTVKSQGADTVTLSFGNMDGKAYTLCLASGETDGRDRKRDWTAFETLATVAADQMEGTYTIPAAIRDGRSFRFFLMQTEGLPYAAEVESVSSTRQQYVDTGVLPTSLTEVELDFSDVTFRHHDALFGQIFGTDRYLFTTQTGDSQHPGGWFRFYGTSGTYTKEVTQDRYICRVASDNSLTLIHDGVSSRFGINRNPSSTAGNLAVFGDASGVYLSSFTFYGMRITNDGEMLRDFIPVADSAGNGCLYDMISGELFRSKTSTPLVAGTTIYTGRIGRVLATTPTLYAHRSVAITAQSANTVTLAFGNPDGNAYTLYVASGLTDGADDKRAWTDFAEVCEIAADQVAYTYTIPSSLKADGVQMRFFLMKSKDLPYARELASVTSTGAQWVHTGYYPTRETGVDMRLGDITYANNAALFCQGYYGSCYMVTLQDRTISGRNYQCFVWYGQTKILDSSVLANTDYRIRVIPGGQIGMSHGGGTETVYSAPFEEGFFAPITIFATPTGAQSSKFRFDSMVITECGAPVRDFVPVEDANGKGALFDRVLGKLHPNESSTDFTKGAVLDETRTGWVIAQTITFSADATKPATATWVGRGNRGNPADPLNWQCFSAAGVPIEDAVPTAETIVQLEEMTDFNIPAGTTLAYRRIETPKQITLTSDCDWRGLDWSINQTVMLNGHKLVLAQLTGEGKITDSAMPGGEIHLDIAQGQTVTNPSLELAGTLKLVVEGGGTYSPTRAQQTYVGGTVIEEGTAALRSSALPSGGIALLTICTNGVFDLNCEASYTSGYAWNDCTMVLAGGRIVNRGDAASKGCQILKTVRLTDDSRMVADQPFGFIAQGWAPTRLDLNGHTLTLETKSDFYFLNTTISNGRLDVTGGDAENGYVSFLGNTVDATSSEIVFGATSRLNVEADLLVGDLDVRVNDSGEAVKGSAKVKVFGTFTPYTDYVHNYEMQNGSTIDLSGWSTAYPAVNKVNGAYKLTFAENARVTVFVGAREDLHEGMKLMGLSDAVGQDVRLVLAGDRASPWMLERRTDGLYLMAFVKSATWTGLANDGDVMNGTNWDCRDASGNVVPNGRPGTMTDVSFSGAIAFNVPAGMLFNWASLTIGNATLTNDCDWTGIQMFTAVQSVNLNGHKLTIAPHEVTDFGTGATFTDTQPAGEGGELHILLPNGVDMSTDPNTCNSLKLTGSLRLVKDGEGTLTLLGQNDYTGGTVVNGGILKAYNTTAETTYALTHYLDFGAVDTTITVNSNAVFDVHGVYEVAQYRIVLNGGTLTSSKVSSSSSGMSAYNNRGIGAVTLTADSTIDVPDSGNHLLFNMQSPYYGDLGGYTLTVDIGNPNSSANNFVCKDYAFTNGTVNIVSGGWFCLCGGAMTWENADIVCKAALRLETDITVRDFSVDYTGGSRFGSGHVLITRRYTPISDYVFNMTLMDGATLNLGEVADLPWTWLPLETVADATYTVELPNDVVLKSGDPVISWAEQPASGVSFKLAPGKIGSLLVDGDGLYFQSGLLIILR